MTNFSDTLEAIRTRHAYSLAINVDHTGITQPDAPNSDGADLLKAARNAVVENVEYLLDENGDTSDDLHRALENLHDGLHDMMDSVPSPMTSTIWSTYVDLAAYRTTLYEDHYGADGADDMTRVAHITLYCIAEEVGRVLLDELIEAVEIDAEEEN